MDVIETTAQHVPATTEKQSFVQAVFGQLKEPSFWVDLFKTMATEAFKAFVYALGGELMNYGGSGRKNLPAPAQSSQVTQKAFGGGYSPSPSYGYNPSPSYPVPSGSPDARFPGFGSR